MTAVITGVGAVSAFGVGATSLFNALAEGRSAIRTIRSFDASTFPTQVAGEVPAVVDATLLRDQFGSTAEPLIERLMRSGALRDRKIAWGLLAAAEAWNRAGCGDAERDARVSIALGLEQAFLEDFTPIFGSHTDSTPTTAISPNAAASARTILWDREPPTPRDEVRFRSRVDLTADAIRELLGLRGPAVVNASACAAGALAVAHAASLIERGAAQVVLCGASDSMVNPLGLGGMCRLGAPSPRNTEDACRPFDRDRDGLVIGEGAAMFVVEDESRAAARGARILARILGWGSTQDAYRVTAPRPDGSAARRAIERALARAARTGSEPTAIGYINAHGTGTPLNDPAEAQAIHGAFGARAPRIPVSSIKGAIGHLMAAAGAIELAASLLVFERDLLPGTAHHRELDPDIARDNRLDVIGPAPRRARVDALLSNSFGFGGQNASVILGRPW